MPLEANKKELSEKDFIHEEYGRNPFRFWEWLAAVAGFSLLFAWGLAKYQDTLTEQYASSPFLQVTNRQFTLFLWQNPRYMRAHASNKSVYLTAFRYNEKIGLTPEYADDFVVAPPEVLFFYHAWHRLVSSQFSSRPMPATDFHFFLQDVEEWQPRYWKQAPQAYIEMVSHLDSYGSRNLNSLPANVMPLEVRQAFIGWKNYFYEGTQINQLMPTYSEIRSFLLEYPHYARNSWRNIAGDSYLQSLSANLNTEKVPDGEIAPFLKVALYNWTLRTTFPRANL